MVKEFDKIPPPKLEYIIHGQSQIPQLSLCSRVAQKSKRSALKTSEREGAFGDLIHRDKDRQSDEKEGGYGASVTHAEAVVPCVLGATHCLQ